MKTATLKTIGLAVILLTTVAFTGNKPKEMQVKDSNISWKGEKITGSHAGTVALKEGTLQMDGDKITGGKFIINMNSITVTDLKGEDRAKLEGHLKSDDFFGVKAYPTSTLTIKSGNKTEKGYYINGEITIKGKTEPIAFLLEMDGNKASTSLEIDRTKFGVRYGSGSFFDNLGDNTIYDEFQLDVNLTF